MGISERINRLRSSAGLNQRSAAELAGLSQTTWSRIESGEHTPKLGEVIGIASALGCLTSTVLGDSELEGRLKTATRKSSDAVNSTDVAEHLQLLLEVEAELRSEGYLQ